MNGRLANTLRGYGFTGTIDEMLYAYYGGTATTLLQREMDWLTAKGHTTGALADRRRAFYRTFGAESNNDLEFRNIASAFPPLILPEGYDPAFTNTFVTLSENNTRMTSSASDMASRSLRAAQGNGKYYFEVVILVPSGGAGIGVCNGSQPMEDWVGASDKSSGMDTDAGNVYYNGQNIGSDGLGSGTTNDVIGVSVDVLGRKAWYSKNGAFGSGQDPVAGTGGFQTPGGGLLVMTSAGSGGSFKLRTLSAQFTQPVPSGYVAWASA